MITDKRTCTRDGSNYTSLQSFINVCAIRIPDTVRIYSYATIYGIVN